MTCQEFRDVTSKDVFSNALVSAVRKHHAECLTCREHLEDAAEAAEKVLDPLEILALELEGIVRAAQYTDALEHDSEL